MDAQREQDKVKSFFLSAKSYSTGISLACGASFSSASVYGPSTRISEEMSFNPARTNHLSMQRICIQVGEILLAFLGPLIGHYGVWA